jgi:hypothetical protein
MVNQIYMRYITSPSVPNDNVNESRCLIDPSLLEDNTNPPQERLPCPKPRQLVGGTQIEDPIARMKARALLGLAMVTVDLTMATVQLATATVTVDSAMATVDLATATVHSATAPVQSATATVEPMTLPSSQSTELPPVSAQIPSASALARRIRRTADDLAQQEAISTQTVGRRLKNKTVKFAGQ